MLRLFRVNAIGAILWWRGQMGDTQLIHNFPGHNAYLIQEMHGQKALIKAYRTMRDMKVNWWVFDTHITTDFARHGAVKGWQHDNRARWLFEPPAVKAIRARIQKSDGANSARFSI